MALGFVKKGLIGFAAVSVLIIAMDNSSKAGVKPAPVLTAEQQAKEDFEAKVFHNIYTDIKFIKENAKDPASVEVIKAAGSKDASTLCVVYRAKNSFGGLVPNQAVFVGNDAYLGGAKWDKICKGNLVDHTQMAKL
jgi:hypothetical protein